MSNSKRVEYKTVWSAVPAAVNAALVSMVHSDVVDPEVAALGAGVAGVAGALVAYNAVDLTHMWKNVTGKRRAHITQWLMAGTSAHAAAIQYAIWSLDGTVAGLAKSLAVLAATGAVTFGVAKFVEWCLRAPEKPQTEAAATTEIVLDTPNPTDDEFKLARVLNQMNVKHLVVAGSVDLMADAGTNYTMNVTPSAPRNFKPNDDLAEAIAIQLKRWGMRDIESDWVRFTKVRGAGEWCLTVMNRDLMADVIEYVDDPTPKSIHDPALAGITITGVEHRESLRQHTRTVGQSTKGKSSLVNLDIADVSRCEDALLWVGGTSKLYELLAEWLQPYLDEDVKPPIDYIAYDHDSLLKMLAGACRLVKHRQAQPIHKRNYRDIVIIIDEFSVPAKDTRSIHVSAALGRMTVSEMYAFLTRTAASSGIWVHNASQRGINDEYGTEGGVITANSAVTRVMATRDFNEVGRQLNDWGAKVPQHPGEYWLLGDGADPVQLKTPYIQSTAKNKKRLHDGATIAEVSWSRRHIDQSGLTDDEGAQAVGEHYINRVQRVTEALLTAILTEGQQITEASDEQIADEMNDLVANVEQQDAKPAADPRVIRVPNSRGDKILAMMQAWQRMDKSEIELGEIREYLVEFFADDATPDAVSATLTKMKTKGLVESPDRGLWRLR